MTLSVSRPRKGLTDSNTCGYSPKNSTEGSNLRSSQVNPRRSLRLMAINGIYNTDDATDSMFPQQTSADNSQHFANQKYETSIIGPSYEMNNVYSTYNNQHGVNQRFENPIGQGDQINDGYSEDCGDKESNMDSDGLIILGMTLKSMQTRCKARKRKNLQSVSSSVSDLKSDPYFGALPQSKQTFLEPKEEEPDLEEPLINLKSELSNKCSSRRKRRKCKHSSESFGPIEETAAQTSSNTLAHWSSPIKASGISSEKGLAVASTSNKNLEPISQKDPLHAGSSESVYDVKYDTTDNYLCGVQIVDNGAVTSTTGFSNKCHAFATSSANLHQNVNGESGNGFSCCFSSDIQSPRVYDLIDMASYNPYRPFSVTGTHLQVDSLEPVKLVKTEALEVVPVSCEDTIYVSHSSTENFIAKSSSSENSSCEPLEIIDEGASKSEGSPYILKEADNYTCPIESTEDHFGEIEGMESSDIYCPKLPPWLAGPMTPSCSDHFELVSATEDLSPDACDVIENQTSPQKETENDITFYEKNHLATTDSQESMSIGYNGLPRMNGDLCNQIDEAIIKMQPCSLQNNVADEHSLLSGGKSNLKFVPYSRLEGGCLDKLVLEAFTGDSLTKGYEDDNVPQTEDFSSPGTYNVETCTSTFDDLHGVETSPKNEAYSSTLEEMVNGYREKATSSKVDDKLSSAGELKAYDHSAQANPPLLSALNGLQDMEDNLCKVTGKLPSSLAEQKLHPTAEIPNYPFEKYYSTDDGQKEFDCVKGVKEEQPPKKLPSNRKNLSPTSQEKLLQALNGDDLCHNQKPSDYGEAELMTSSNIMSKRMRSSTNGSPLPVTKGILRFPDKPGSTCSCTNSSLMHTQAQKAIEFTQRQMQDIETIASKLLKELKSMKNIVQAGLSPDECPLGPPKLTREEIRIAAENASGLETKTRKWLSMMSKDSNRFCKIMRTEESPRATEDTVATSVSGRRKRHKKIIFADEAGGLLCHVKLFEASFEERQGTISEV